MDVILSTRNPSKLLQIQTVFEGTPIKVLSLDDAGVEGEAVEDGDTLEANAFKKAQFAFERAPRRMWAMADDTGLFIEVLDGAPGHHAARWAGDVSTDEITQYTLSRLEGVSNRRAVFRTVVALIGPGDVHAYMKGEVGGTILEAPRTKPQPKMPYSPIFVPDGDTRVWAEMPTEEENAISHRGIAFRKAREFLLDMMKTLSK